MTTIAFLGPRATFTEAALRAMPVSEGAELVSHRTVVSALTAVHAGDADLALVPIENSLEGTVAGSLDELATGDQPLCIVDEYALPVRFCLVARPGTALSDVNVIATHPAAEAQTRGWRRENLPDADVILAASTAAAAAGLANEVSGAENPADYDAAIAPQIAADHYGLEVIADDIGDRDTAATRFVLVSRPVPPPPPSGSDKTTLALFMREDQSGALLEILTELAVRGVNLTRIESRPTKVALGDYFFVVDAEGHVNDHRIGEAMMGLHRVCAHVRYLGSYPRHDGRKHDVLPRTTDADYVAADAWLSQIRESGLSAETTQS